MSVCFWNCCFEDLIVASVRKMCFFFTRAVTYYGANRIRFSSTIPVLSVVFYLVVTCDRLSWLHLCFQLTFCNFGIVWLI